MMARCCVLVSLLITCIGATSVFPIKWSSKTYGLDGPWYAVAATVGGYDDGSDPWTLQTPVDLFPGGTWFSTIINPGACNTSASSNCGQGGTWNPKTAWNGALANQTQSGASIGLQMTDANFAGDMRYMTADVYAQRMVLNGQGSNNFPQLAIQNSTLAVTSNASMLWPNGRKTSLEVGNLALGADDARMNFTQSKNPDDNIVTWNAPGWLGLSGQGSNTYTIHIGSTALAYPPSLIFGGYDKGRGVGNIVSWSSSALTLNDLVLGVETGGSPWDFTSKSGLLLNNASEAKPLPVYADPIAPYLHLPEATCRNLAQHLPIYYDVIAKYYLWNMSDPSYKKIITSATYLGFVFPPSFGSMDPVTIKVPLLYLNLTLQPDASGLQTPVAYFPCQNYYPDYRPLATANSLGGTYTLGRAFLQSALLGRNWNKGISWLAQAPGPGADMAGLGYSPQTLSNDDLTLSLPSDSTLFNSTMKGYWTPLPQAASSLNSSNSSSPVPSSSISATPNASVSASPDAGLSTGAKAGIGIGAAAGVVALVLIGVLMWVRRTRRRRTPYDGHDNATVPPYPQQWWNGHPQVAEVETIYPRVKHYPSPQEMSGVRDPREIDSRNIMGRRYELQ